MSFRLTKRQELAISILASEAKHCLLFGGSRSGKTFLLVRSIIIRACKAKSRHIILRQHFNHIKTSVWLETLPKVLSTCFPHLTVKWNKTDYFIELPNGSTIFVAGLDDEKHIEKILGKEFSTIYFNECSQLGYNSVQIALTRLAEKSDLRKELGRIGVDNRQVCHLIARARYHDNRRKTVYHERKRARDAWKKERSRWLRKSPEKRGTEEVNQIALIRVCWASTKKRRQAN